MLEGKIRISGAGASNGGEEEADYFLEENMAKTCKHNCEMQNAEDKSLRFAG